MWWDTGAATSSSNSAERAQSSGEAHLHSAQEQMFLPNCCARATTQTGNDPGEMTANGEAAALVTAIRTGDVAALQQLLDEQSGLASVRIGGRLGNRTPLHVVTDWPGYFPNGPQVVRLLIA